MQVSNKVLQAVANTLRERGMIRTQGLGEAQELVDDIGELMLRHSLNLDSLHVVIVSMIMEDWWKENDVP